MYTNLLVSSLPQLLLLLLLHHHPASVHSQPTAPSWATENRVVPSCGPEESTCTFNLHLDYIISMAHPHKQNGTQRASPVYISPEDGSATRRVRPGCDVETPLSREELLQSNIHDGTRKVVKGVNGHVPGQPIVVYVGQQVVITVHNHLDGETTTMHWHGLRQLGTPYMDGAGGVSQCSIDQGQSFTYRFFVDEPGTYWYHSHHGFQRSEGVYGAFIVLPTPQPTTPVYDGDFLMILADFYHQSTIEVAIEWMLDLGISTSHSSYNECYEGRIPQFVSALVNGKGRHYPDNGAVAENPGVPLEKYHVEAGKLYRFRIINAALENAFRVSVDGHLLHVIASDGKDVQEVVVDHVLVSAGERYDVLINTTRLGGLDSYLMRVEGPANPYNGLPGGHTEAILHYTGGEDTDHPVSSKRACTEENPCLTLNCPMETDFQASLHEHCIPIGELRGVSSSPLWVEGAQFAEFFFNLRFTNGTTADSIFLASINGIKNQAPATPPMTYPPYDFRDRPCEKEDCTGEVCVCNHVRKLPLGANIQMTFLVQGPTFAAPLATHPLHLHGHHFEVVRVGLPSYDPVSGQMMAPNEDITCLDTYCNNVTWADSTWTNGNLPSLTDSPPLKDTISVPAGGYITVRFRADNPGFWYMHCHMEYHNHGGMGMLFQAGEVEDMPPLPQDFPRCGSFDFSALEFSQIYALPNVSFGTDNAAAAARVELRADDDDGTDTPTVGDAAANWLESPLFLYAIVITLVCTTVLLGGTCLVLLGQRLARRHRAVVRYVFLDDHGREVNDKTALLGSHSLSHSL